MNQNGVASEFDMCFARTTLGAGSQRLQPKHVSNPDSVTKKFNHHWIDDRFCFRPCNADGQHAEKQRYRDPGIYGSRDVQGIVWDKGGCVCVRHDGAGNADTGVPLQ